jgi:hypothetical protein
MPPVAAKVVSIFSNATGLGDNLADWYPRAMAAVETQGQGGESGDRPMVSNAANARRKSGEDHLDLRRVYSRSNS